MHRTSYQILVGALIWAVILGACSGAAAPTPPPTPVPATPALSRPPAELADPMGEDSFAIGERIFKDNASQGVGCQACHAPDGRGDIGPNIRGKTPGDIQFALQSVEAMNFIHLNQKEVEAVSEYLQWLATQP